MPSEVDSGEGMTMMAMTIQHQPTGSAAGGDDNQGGGCNDDNDGSGKDGTDDIDPALANLGNVGREYHRSWAGWAT